jgi:hypothetical protein
VIHLVRENRRQRVKSFSGILMHATTIHISSSHVPMLSHPAQVANFIATAAGK